MRVRAVVAVAASLMALALSPAGAADLVLPQGAQQTVERATDPDGYRMPVGRYGPEGLPVARLEGRIQREAWRIDGPSATVLQLFQPLRLQLEEAGWNILFECETRGCGGFDFRFAAEILPAPEMYVDITNYRYLAAQGPNGSRFVSVLVSRNAAAGFIQIIRMDPSGSRPAQTDASAAAPLPAASGPVAEQLEAQGHAVLSDLVFQTGSSSLGEGPFPSLVALADYLRARPSRRIVLVGHTDAEGSLEGNRALSQRRANSVRRALIDLGVPAEQLDADGVGYLNPLTSNDTPEGRERNRRVEAVLLGE